MQVAEMRMLKYMGGFSRQDSLEVADIRDRMRGHRLRRFGHVMRRDEEARVRAIQGLKLEGRQGRRGRPNLTWDQMI